LFPPKFAISDDNKAEVSAILTQFVEPPVRDSEVIPGKHPDEKTVPNGGLAEL